MLFEHRLIVGYVMCYVIRILGFEEVVTTNAQTITFGKLPRRGLSNLRSVSKILD